MTRNTMMPRCLAWSLAIALQAAPAFGQGTRGAGLPADAQEAANKGMIAAKQQDYLLAIRYFEEARKIAPAAAELYSDLGLAESKLPGRELRAIGWFEAYLAADPYTLDWAAVQAQITVLDVQSQSNLSRLIRLAQDAARAMPDRRRDEDCEWVAQLWAGAGDFAAAQKACDLIGKQAVPMRIAALASIAAARAEAGDIAGAQSTLAAAQDNEMELANRAGHTPEQLAKARDEVAHARLAICRAQLVAGDLGGARATGGLITNQGLADTEDKVGALLEIARAQRAAGDIAAARATLAEAQAIADSMADMDAVLRVGMPGARLSLLRSVADAQLRAGDLSGARKTVDLLANAHERGEVLVAIAKARLGVDDVAGAQETLAHAAEVVESIEEPYVKRRDAGAIALLARKVSTILAGRDKVGQLEFVAEAQAEVGDVVGALKSIDRMEGSHVNALMTVSRVQMEAGDIAGALRTAELIADGDWKGSTQGDIAHAQTRMGDLAGAARTAEGIGHTASRNNARAAIAEAQARIGDVAGAQEMIGLIEDAALQEKTRVAVVEAQAGKRDFVGARATVELIHDSESRAEAQRDIVQAQVDARDVEGALKTCGLIQDLYYRDQAQAYVAEAQAREGDIAGALATAGLIQEGPANAIMMKCYARAAIAAAQLKGADAAGAQKSVRFLVEADPKTEAQQYVAQAHARAGNIAAAQQAVELLEKPGSKMAARVAIAKAQAEAGDIDSAHETAALVGEAGYRYEAYEAIALAQARAGQIGRAFGTADLIRDGRKRQTVAAIHLARLRLPAPIRPEVAAWLERLDDADENDDCPLGTEPFMDLRGYLKAIPRSDNPQKGFESLVIVAGKLANAQHAVDLMMKQGR